MPEEFAKMDDLYVDLEIIEEDKKPSRYTTKTLESYEHLVCIERTEKNTNARQSKRKTERVKRILVKGGPGTGKSSTVSKLAYDWACSKQDSPISRFKLVFVITVNEINTEADLVEIIQDQLLPEISAESLRAYIQSNASSIVILLDGYDEASNPFHQCKELKNILQSKWLAEACVIVTRRPNRVGALCQNYGPYLQVEIRGFSTSNQVKYIHKFMKFQTCSSERNEDDNSQYDEQKNRVEDS